MKALGIQLCTFMMQIVDGRFNRLVMNSRRLPNTFMMYLAYFHRHYISQSIGSKERDNNLIVSKDKKYSNGVG
jgi:hypothetical protein